MSPIDVADDFDFVLQHEALASPAAKQEALIFARPVEGMDHPGTWTRGAVFNHVKRWTVGSVLKNTLGLPKNHGNSNGLTGHCLAE